MHLVLTSPSVRRKRHESVMNSAMNMWFAAGRNSKYPYDCIINDLESFQDSVFLFFAAETVGKLTERWTDFALKGENVI